MPDRNIPPSADELEVSLFGPGYGEAILVHAGKNEWIAVDSCSEAGVSAIRSYLELLKVDVETALKVIVVTHWHDDHIRGLADLFSLATSAEFVYPAVFGSEQFQTFAHILNSPDPSPFGRETSEIVRAFRCLVDENRKGIPALVDKLIYRSDDCEIFALSPSNNEYQRFIRNIGGITPAASPPISRRRVGAIAPNDTAIVLQVTTPSGSVLLGSDLEEHGVSGWTAIVEGAKALRPGSDAVKIPHHGSQNAHCHALWNAHLQAQPYAILTPFVRGGVTLPSESDVARLSSLTKNGYSTARLDARPATRRSAEVQRALRENGVRLKRSEPKMGHIRLRRSLTSATSWVHELFENAVPLDQVYA